MFSYYCVWHMPLPLLCYTVNTSPCFFQAEMGWSEDRVDADTWLQHYATRRYGSYSPMTQKAWAVLKPSAYSFQYSSNLKSLMDVAPSFGLSYYTRPNATGILEAWQLLYQAAITKEIDPSVGPFQYDLVDIGRQCLVNLFFDLYSSFEATYHSVLNNPALDGSERVTLIKPITDAMLKLILDTDKYLATNVNFLLGVWVSDAAATVFSPLDKANAVYNALNQVTTWGPAANNNDYACKDWSGLLSSYYHKRWTFFIDYILKTVGNKDSINSTWYSKEMFSLEVSFSHDKTSFPTEPTGDPMLIAKELLDSYVNPDLIETNYLALLGTGIQGHDILGEQGPYVKNINQVAYLCSVNPLCTGFSSEGQLKNSTGPYTLAEGTTFYVKKL